MSLKGFNYYLLEEVNKLRVTSYGIKHITVLVQKYPKSIGGFRTALHVVWTHVTSKASSIYGAVNSTTDSYHF